MSRSLCRCDGSTTLCAFCDSMLARAQRQAVDRLAAALAPPGPAETRAWEARDGASQEAEKDFMARVVGLAKMNGYRVFHPYRSDRSTPGWFDLAMARAGDKLVLAELKRAGGKQTEAQRNWFEDLQRIEVVKTFLWYPSDYNEIVDILTRKQ